MRNFFERTGFLKQMRCTRYDLQLLHAPDLFVSVLIHPNDWSIKTADY